jgi:hypothetical protein
MVLRAVLVTAAATFALATAAPADAGSLEDCGQRVIRDWYSGGRVEAIYPLPCYRAAIRALPDDVLQYTDATTVIERALESARQGAVRRPAPSAHETKPAPSPASKPSGAKAPWASSSPLPAAKAPPAAPHPTSAPPHHPPRLASGPTHARAEAGIPYPLIALGALSLVLLASGLAAALARRRT